ncbi:hypothetical protein GPX89_41270 [Nocardia sp. ET3-3]|uniref:Uncharacterized protein n=1 Tax=Nocardia terrae TaxID=2675851 RepID=A0A7K1VC01_9NOCA|nr:hypothetical protein [Nocardia terrae]MVU83658.1 hypothetical protein [Nocardia terrae]
MGQQPRPVLDVNVTVGPWVISSVRGLRARSKYGEVGNAWEPAAFGLYRDRDGDIWEKGPQGWRLQLQGGVPVDPDTIWDWSDSVREFAPFTPWG